MDFVADEPTSNEHGREKETKEEAFELDLVGEAIAKEAWAEMISGTCLVDPSACPMIDYTGFSGGETLVVWNTQYY